MKLRTTACGYRPILVLIGLITAGLAGCGREKNREEFKGVTVSVEVVRAKRDTIKETLSLVGDITAEDEAAVCPKVTGKVIEKLVKEGDVVKKRDPILIVDRDEVGFKFEKAPVEAPIDGVVGKIYVDKGANVSPAIPVAVLVNMDRVKVRTEVAEQDLPRLAESQEAEVQVDAYPEEVFSGRVSEISPMVDPVTRKASVQVIIDNPDHRLKPGMFARVEIVLEKHENTLVIPRKAVVKQDGKELVFVIDRSVARAKQVKKGLSDEQRLEIIDGLDEEDLVIVQGNYGLEDGVKVELRDSKR